LIKFITISNLVDDFIPNKFNVNFKSLKMFFIEEDNALINILYMIIGNGLRRVMTEFPGKGGIRSGLDF